MDKRLIVVRILSALTIIFLPFNSLGKSRNLSLPEEIRTNINLQGDTVYLKKGAVVRFRDGKICNGTIIFNGNKLIEPCFENVRYQGSLDGNFFNIKDFGAKPNLDMDCSDIINDLIKLKIVPEDNNNPKHIYIPKGFYYIDKPIELFAGWNSPVTLLGEGRMSCICQRNDNQPIIRFFEQNHIKDIQLSYKNKQDASQIKSVAIACQRSIHCLFENIIISKANTAFGYMSLEDQKNGYNPTGYREQCYVSSNFRNIRVYDISGYAFDFIKDFPQGDSGSAFDNIYINCNDINGNSQNSISRGAIRGDNTVACFTQLNIEGANYTGALIDLSGMSRVSVESLHLEGIKNMPSIAKVRVQSVASFNMIDVQACEFSRSQYNAFEIKDSGLAIVKLLTLRQDCRKTSTEHKPVLSNNLQRLKIEQKLDAIKLF